MNKQRAGFTPHFFRKKPKVFILSPFSRKGGGFTLVELLAAIVIIGILTSIVLVAMSSARGKAKDARAMADLMQIQTAMEMYRSAHGFYPDLPLNYTLINDPASAAARDALSPYLSPVPVSSGPPVGLPEDPDYLWDYLWTDNGWRGTKYCIFVILGKSILGKSGEIFYVSYNGSGKLDSFPEPPFCPNF